LCAWLKPELTGQDTIVKTWYATVNLDQNLLININKYPSSAESTSQKSTNDPTSNLNRKIAFSQYEQRLEKQLPCKLNQPATMKF